MGGLAGVLYGNKIGDTTQTNGCINEGNLTCGNIVNTGSGAYSAFNQGGIAGYIEIDEAYIGYAINKGNISAPSGRGGGIVGTLQEGTIENSTNEGLIQDDVNDVFASNSKRYNVKRIGGLAGGINTDKYLKNCINNGNVYSQNGSRAGGFVGHNAGFVQSCTNNGIILSDATADGANKHGAGWACGYSGTKLAQTISQTATSEAKSEITVFTRTIRKMLRLPLTAMPSATELSPKKLITSLIRMKHTMTGR